MTVPIAEELSETDMGELSHFKNPFLMSVFWLDVNPPLVLLSN